MSTPTHTPWKDPVTNAQNAFDAFFKSPTPLGAVRLAVADALAHRLKDWTFVDQLREAERLIAAVPEASAERDRIKEINAELLAALKIALPALIEHSNSGRMSEKFANEDGYSEPLAVVQHAIARAENRS